MKPYAKHRALPQGCPLGCCSIMGHTHTQRLQQVGIALVWGQQKQSTGLGNKNQTHNQVMQAQGKGSMPRMTPWVHLVMLGRGACGNHTTALVLPTRHLRRVLGITCFFSHEADVPPKVRWRVTKEFMWPNTDQCNLQIATPGGMHMQQCSAVPSQSAGATELLCHTSLVVSVCPGELCFVDP